MGGKEKTALYWSDGRASGERGRRAVNLDLDLNVNVNLNLEMAGMYMVCC